MSFWKTFHNLMMGENRAFWYISQKAFHLAKHLDPRRSGYINVQLGLIRGNISRETEEQETAMAFFKIWLFLQIEESMNPTTESLKLKSYERFLFEEVFESLKSPMSFYTQLPKAYEEIDGLLNDKTSRIRHSDRNLANY